MGIICYQVLPVHCETVRRLVDEGQFNSYSEAARYIIRSFIDFYELAIIDGYTYGITTRFSPYVKVSSKFPVGMLADINAAAGFLGITRSEFIRQAFDWYIDQLENWKELKK